MAESLPGTHFRRDSSSSKLSTSRFDKETGSGEGRCVEAACLSTSRRPSALLQGVSIVFIMIILHSFRPEKAFVSD